MTTEPLTLTGSDLTPQAIAQVARQGRPGALAPEALARMAAGRAVVERHLAADRPVYGLTTGLGARVTHRLPREALAEFSRLTLLGRANAVGPRLPADVVRALVSSTPDDGTLALRQAAPNRVAPLLRPYRGDISLGNWTRDPNLMAYVEERLALGSHLGIGEVHVADPSQLETPQMAALIDLAARRGLFLQVHSGAAPIRALFAADPSLKILWAHAGMSEPAEVVGEMLDRYGHLWTETSFRAGDILNGDTIDPSWRKLFLRHSDRFLIGSDTYVPGRWAEYTAIIAAHRAWLAQLPGDVAKAIAYGNAVRLLGDGGLPELAR